MSYIDIAVLGGFLTYINPIYAYIDPGTASFILQAVVGGVAAAGIFFRSHIARILGKLRPKKQMTDPSPANIGGAKKTTDNDD